MTFTEREYLDAVECHAAEVLRRVRDEGADLYDALHEGADNSQWVIYTGRARAVLAWSKNENAAWDVDGVDTFRTAKSMDDIFTVGAFFALRQDIEEAVARLREDEGDA